jgi:hypothetical protein
MRSLALRLLAVVCTNASVPLRAPTHASQFTTFPDAAHPAPVLVLTESLSRTSAFWTDD